MAKLFRHSPLNSIWEGSGNVIALDILRGYKALPALLADIARCKGADTRLDLFIAALQTSLATIAKDPMSSGSQRAARNVVDRLALAMQASVMIRYGDEKVSSINDVSLYLLYSLYPLYPLYTPPIPTYTPYPLSSIPPYTPLLPPSLLPSLLLSLPPLSLAHSPHASGRTSLSRLSHRWYKPEPRSKLRGYLHLRRTRM